MLSKDHYLIRLAISSPSQPPNTNKKYIKLKFSKFKARSREFPAFSHEVIMGHDTLYIVLCRIKMKHGRILHIV